MWRRLISRSNAVMTGKSSIRDHKTMRHTMIRSLIGAGMALTAMVSCKDINTDPDVVTSVEFVRLVSPSIIAGDTLRDTFGVAQPLQAIAYNIENDPVTSAPIRFRVLDTGIVIDSISGVIVGGTTLNRAIRIVADARGLQTQPQTLFIISPPDSAETITTNGLDSVLYTFTDTSVTSPDLRLRVLSEVNSVFVPVRAYVVSFAFESQDDTTFAEIVGDNNRRSLIDTTASDGIAGRRIRIRTTQLQAATDTVVVLGTVKYRGVELPGSPIRFVLQIKPKP